jgi:hypothetical protein
MACGGSKKQAPPPQEPTQTAEAPKTEPTPPPASPAPAEPAPAAPAPAAPEPAPPAKDPMGACSEAKPAVDKTAPFTVKAKIGAAKVEPKASKATVQGVVTKNLARVECCFREQVAAKEDLKKNGKTTITAELTIGMDGKVTDAKADGGDADQSACVGAVLKTLEFKAGKAEVKATVPFDATVTVKKAAAKAAAKAPEKAAEKPAEKK